MDEPTLLAELERIDVEYRRVEHEAVFTVAQSLEIDKGFDAVGTKNLFLRDKKGQRFFLVVVAQHKNVDLKRLARVVGSDRFSFGSPEKLREILGVDPGSVTLLAKVNDPENRAELFIDEDVRNAERMTCHPLVNTSTVELSRKALETFLEAFKVPSKTIPIPEKDA